MRKFAISVEISAPPARVWEVMSDVDRWHEWTPSITSVKRIKDAPLAIGSFIFTAAVTMWPASGGSFQPGSFDRPSDRRRQVWQPLDLHRRAARRRSIRRRRLDVPGRREDLAPTVKALSGARRRSVVSRLRCWRGRLQIDVRRRSSRNQWLRRHESEGGRHGGDWPRRLRGHRVP